MNFSGKHFFGAMACACAVSQIFVAPLSAQSVEVEVVGEDITVPFSNLPSYVVAPDGGLYVFGKLPNHARTELAYWSHFDFETGEQMNAQPVQVPNTNVSFTSGSPSEDKIFTLMRARQNSSIVVYSSDGEVLDLDVLSSNEISRSNVSRANFRYGFTSIVPAPDGGAYLGVSKTSSESNAIVPEIWTLNSHGEVVSKVSGSPFQNAVPSRLISFEDGSVVMAASIDFGRNGVWLTKYDRTGRQIFDWRKARERGRQFSVNAVFGGEDGRTILAADTIMDGSDREREIFVFSRNGQLLSDFVIDEKYESSAYLGDGVMAFLKNVGERRIRLDFIDIQGEYHGGEEFTVDSHYDQPLHTFISGGAKGALWIRSQNLKRGDLDGSYFSLKRIRVQRGGD